jgi:hypothetical protein
MQSRLALKCLKSFFVQGASPLGPIQGRCTLTLLGACVPQTPSYFLNWQSGCVTTPANDCVCEICMTSRAVLGLV